MALAMPVESKNSRPCEVSSSLAALDHDNALIRSKWFGHPAPSPSGSISSQWLLQVDRSDTCVSWLQDPERVAKLRAQLSSISWFMKALQEPIARRANKKSKKHGHFFSGRFGSTHLIDEAAKLACAIYADYWLCPIDEDVAIPCLASPEREGEIEFKKDVPPTVHLYRGGTVRVTLEQYLKILDWTGRQVRAGKPGAISPDVAPILERMGISADGWYELTTSFRDLFTTQYIGTGHSTAHRPRLRSASRCGASCTIRMVRRAGPSPLTELNGRLRGTWSAKVDADRIGRKLRR